MWEYQYTDELYHWGIKGQKWGVRRTEAQLARVRGKKQIEEHEDYKNAHSKKSIKEMSNQELKSRNNRLQMEKQYKDLNRQKNVGKKALDTFIAVGGTLSAVAGAIATYKKIGGPLVEKALKVIGKSKGV